MKPLLGLSRRLLLRSIAAVGMMGVIAAPSHAESPRAQSLLGYTEFRTHLAGGRHANVVTMRAVVVKVSTR